MCNYSFQTSETVFPIHILNWMSKVLNHISLLVHLATTSALFTNDHKIFHKFLLQRQCLNLVIMKAKFNSSQSIKFCQNQLVIVVKNWSILGARSCKIMRMTKKNILAFTTVLLKSAFKVGRSDSHNNRDIELA